MAAETVAEKHVRSRIMPWFLIVAFISLVACAGEQPKPMQQPSPEQVKGSADRSFDKLKQEERERKPVGQ
jgi:hypothetical protein